MEHGVIFQHEDEDFFVQIRRYDGGSYKPTKYAFDILIYGVRYNSGLCASLDGACKSAIAKIKKVIGTDDMPITLIAAIAAINIVRDRYRPIPSAFKITISDFERRLYSEDHLYMRCTLGNASVVACISRIGIGVADSVVTIGNRQSYRGHCRDAYQFLNNRYDTIVSIDYLDWKKGVS